MNAKSTKSISKSKLQMGDHSFYPSSKLGIILGLNISSLCISCKRVKWWWYSLWNRVGLSLIVEFGNLMTRLAMSLSYKHRLVFLVGSDLWLVHQCCAWNGRNLKDNNNNKFYKLYIIQLSSMVCIYWVSITNKILA